MRIVIFPVFLTALLVLSGCDRTEVTPGAARSVAAPSDNRPAVEIHTPNVDVKTGKDGTSVTAPGTDVHVERKQP